MRELDVECRGLVFAYLEVRRPDATVFLQAHLDAIGTQQTTLSDDCFALDATIGISYSGLFIDNLSVGVLNGDEHFMICHDSALVVAVVVDDSGPLNDLARTVNAQVGVNACSIRTRTIGTIAVESGDWAIVVVSLAHPVIKITVAFVVRHVDRAVLGGSDTPIGMSHSSAWHRLAGGIVNDDNAIDRRCFLSLFADDAWACLTDIERRKVIDAQIITFAKVLRNDVLAVVLVDGHNDVPAIG